MSEDKKELQNKIVELKKKLLGLRIKNSSGELSDVSEVRKIKKEIARLFTKLNAQE